MHNTILLAEDFEDDANAVQQVLKEAGVMNPVVVVTDGDEVIAYLNGEGRFSDRQRFALPGVLLLDLKMPRVHGFEVLEWIRAQPQFEKLLIIVLSGYDEIGQVRKAYDLGARSFLVKPCHIEDVRNLAKAFSGYWERIENFLPLNPDGATPSVSI
jgi:CheY-like chemotaxis protein